MECSSAGSESRERACAFGQLLAPMVTRKFSTLLFPGNSLCPCRTTAKCFRAPSTTRKDSHIEARPKKHNSGPCTLHHRTQVHSQFELCDWETLPFLHIRTSPASNEPIPSRTYLTRQGNNKDAIGGSGTISRDISRMTTYEPIALTGQSQVTRFVSYVTRSASYVTRSVSYVTRFVSEGITSG